MPEHDSKQVTVFSVTYDAGVYTDKDIKHLQDEIEELGSIRIRAHYAPAAGWGVDITMVIEFVGISIASGLIGHITTKFYESLVKKIKNFYQEKRKPGWHFPRSIDFSYDDTDVIILFLDDNSLENLPKLIQDINRELIENPPQGIAIHQIIVPMVYTDGYWQAYNHDNPPQIMHQDRYRYWRIAARDASGIPHIYDSHERKFMDEGIEPDDLVDQFEYPANDLLTSLLETPVDLDKDAHTIEAVIIPIIRFLEPDVTTKKREVVDAGTNKQGIYVINDVEITEFSNYNEDLAQLTCADGSVHYVLHIDVAKFFRG